MRRKSTGFYGFRRELQSHWVTVCHIFRGVLLSASCALLIPSLMADGTPWGVSVVQTGINLNLNGAVPLLAPGGDLYFFNSTGQLIKEDATGRQIFAIDTPSAPSSIVWSPDGNILVGNTKLSGVDGHVLYSTFIQGVVAGDSAGNAYFADVSSGGLSLEKLNPSGTSIYQSSLQGPLSFTYVSSIAADAIGNAYVTGWAENSSGSSYSSYLAKFDTEGGTQTYLLGNPNETGLSVGLDSAGNPEVLMVSDSYPTHSRVLKYNSALVTMLFDTPMRGFEPSAMLVSSEGTAVVLGGTGSVNLPEIRPTAPCRLPRAPESVQPVYPLFSNSVMVRLDTAGKIGQSTFIPGDLGSGNGFAQPNLAEIAIADEVTGQIEVLTIGPAPELQLGCLGNAASFLAGPLAPLEIISIFGQNLGPAQATSGQPGAGNIYPLQLAGVEVTFDGVAAPLVYVSATQINAVTPLELIGNKTTHVCALVDGVFTNCMDAPVELATPGIFMSGGYAAALNYDGTINSQNNPAPAGSVVSIFATGLGTITPPVPDGSLIGLPLPSQDLQIGVSTLLGINQQENAYVYGGANVLYAGPAPYEIEGLSQINFQVPQTGGIVFISASSSGIFGTSTAIGAPIWTTGQMAASCQLLGTC